jgi:NAD(P)H-hydrate epimerase
MIGERLEGREVEMEIPYTNLEIPFIDATQMREVDRAMIQDYHIELIQMMENAGRSLAHLARMRFLNGEPENQRVVILAGTGGNGGGALVCARHLHNWGAQVHVVVARPAMNFKPVPAHQLDILQRMQVSVIPAHKVDQAKAAQLIIDGLIGYSLKGTPYGDTAYLIKWSNSQNSPVLSLDTPSGLDTSTGTLYHPAIRATATMTLALPKEGLRAPGVKDHVGELYLADISVPPSLYLQPGLAIQIGPLFAESELLRLW